MNYLAHAFLSLEDPDLLAGNYLADLMHPRDLSALPPGVLQGIELHRFIDSYTDGHTAVKSCTRMLHPVVHKYAPVVVDIYFDFLLEKNWQKLAKSLIHEFREKVYEQLRSHSDIPEAYSGRMMRMIESDWLVRSSTYDHLHQSFLYLERKTSFPSNLGEASAVLRKDEKVFEAHFLDFFPTLVSEVDKWVHN